MLILGFLLKNLYLCDVKHILVILVVFMAFRPVVPLLEYIIQYDYIVNELCENKEKPQMHCNGKCHLNKALSQSTSTDEQKKEDFKLFNALSIPAILPQETTISITKAFKNNIVSYFHYNTFGSECFLSIDIPPRLLLNVIS